MDPVRLKDPGTDGVLHAQAVHIHQVAADADLSVAVMPRDKHGGVTVASLRPGSSSGQGWCAGTASSRLQPGLTQQPTSSSDLAARWAARSATNLATTGSGRPSWRAIRLGVTPAVRRRRTSASAKSVSASACFRTRRLVAVLTRRRISRASPEWAVPMMGAC